MTEPLPSPIPDDLLAAWEQTCQQATPGPWDYHWDGNLNRCGTLTLRGKPPPRTYVLPNTLPHGDAAFIAEAREAMPALLAEVRRLRAENARMAVELHSLLSQEVQDYHDPANPLAKP